MIKKIINSIKHRFYYSFYRKNKKITTNIIVGKVPYFFQKIKLIRSLSPAFISTMTKSGTWYNREFFYFYNQLILGKTSKQILEKMISKKLKLSALIKSNFSKTGYDAFFISHWECPNFSINNISLKKEWKKLQYYCDYNYPSFLGQVPSNISPKMIERRFNTKYNWNPKINNEAKIIYFFRNPLDQSVSYFQGIQKMKLQDLRYRVNSKGEKKLIKSIPDFIRTVGMDMYIKHFFPFKIMKEKYPNNYLLIEYESLVRNPHKIFNKIFNFLDVPLNTNEKKRCFSEALRLSNKENIIQLENAYGRSIGGQFMDEFVDERQLRNGKVGKWKNYLNNDDLSFIDKKLNIFELSLNHFIID
tara:strand:- start:14247 stop:15323 length:1077 start_codon:yes stop_codon:yes gene_type:complete